MSFQTFTCCICGKTDITKKTSYLIEGKGRACRSHEEAQNARNSIILNEQHNQTLKENKNKDHSGKLLPVKNPFSYCWCCGKDGKERRVIKDDLYALMKAVINYQHHTDTTLDGRIENELLQLEVDEHLKNQPITDANVLYTINLNSFHDWQIKQLVGKTNMFIVARMENIAFLCKVCANEYKLISEQEHFNMEKQLDVINTIYDQIKEKYEITKETTDAFMDIVSLETLITSMKV